ncbi:hypothetical protein [Bailinhaonella thermotolerans]|uniref:Metallothionein n=1 Tax=Bailinhaonella thermotolerans TaxID=1070861 RepID=A0A3A4ATF1_9ACTN|nr:hypothetical protein [Bailinhaonella thermotolerans]RJL33260.1 hypothetical protein D5H75_10570 [Bailinhaonella thermotolerans]
MARCDVCGNDYDRTFAVRTSDGRDFTFDSVECAASAIAPECAHCGCRILGHGVETQEGTTYCCAACARQSGAEAIRA